MWNQIFKPTSLEVELASFCIGRVVKVFRFPNQYFPHCNGGKKLKANSKEISQWRTRTCYKPMQRNTGNFTRLDSSYQIWLLGILGAMWKIGEYGPPVGLNDSYFTSYNSSHKLKKVLKSKLNHTTRKASLGL